MPLCRFFNKQKQDPDIQWKVYNIHVTFNPPLAGHLVSYSFIVCFIGWGGSFSSFLVCNAHRFPCTWHNQHRNLSPSPSLLSSALSPLAARGFPGGVHPGNGRGDSGRSFLAALHRPADMGPTETKGVPHSSPGEVWTTHSVLQPRCRLHPSLSFLTPSLFRSVPSLPPSLTPSLTH